MGNITSRQVYHLCQETPLIHFQHDQEGACLRASEVKPQLDRFLIGKLGGQEAMRKHSEMKKWFQSDEHPALNYKMSIRALGDVKKSTEIDAAEESIRICGRPSCNEVHVDVPIGKSYFGNMVKFERGINEAQKIKAVKEAYKETVFYQEGLELTIVCFNKGLQKEIYDNIAAFFLLHNFGTRSNKGFGSFTVRKCNKEDMLYDYQALLNRECAFPIYLVKPTVNGNRTALNPSSDYSTLLNYANDLYKLMKSGVNQQGDYFRAFIYQYMHTLRRPIGNEKAWLKTTGIAPVVGKSINSRNHEHHKLNRLNEADFKYVRAVLGVGDTIRFVNVVDPHSGRPDFHFDTTQVSIERTDSGNVVERFRCASPVVFKIFQGKLYILPFPVNPEILGKEFTFSSSVKTGRSKTTKSAQILTPAAFDMNDFAARFADYINADCDPAKYNNNTNRKLSGANRNSLKFRGTLEVIK